MGAVAVTASVGWAIGRWLALRDDGAAARRRRQAEIVARADRQHTAVLAGDELVGTYGDYPPAV
jgi:hypothetical protein